jgi:hypothetical protein
MSTGPKGERRPADAVARAILAARRGSRPVAKYLIAHNTPTRVIGFKLGRSESAIYSKAFDLGYSVKPTNQSPYNRLKDK